jgi:glyoxylate reductase
MPQSLILVDVPLAPFIEELFAPDCRSGPWSLLQEGSKEALKEVEGLFLYGHPIIDGSVMDRFPNLKVISNFGVGIDHVDLAAAAARDIPVGNTPGAVEGATADMTLALLLACARNVVAGDRFARGPGFLYYDPTLFLGREVHGSTLGIIGLGRIGREVARRARGFDMRILYHSRHRKPEAEKELGVEYVSLRELLEQAHFVTLNVPMTSETRHLIGEAQLAWMRPDGILVNVARGGVVDHAALYRALAEKRIAGAAIDVTEPEPLPRDHPLLRLTNLVITPHLGSAGSRTRLRMGQMTVDNIRAGLQGKPLPYPVRLP